MTIILTFQLASLEAAVLGAQLIDDGIVGTLEQWWSPQVYAGILYGLNRLRKFILGLKTD